MPLNSQLIKYPNRITEILNNLGFDKVVPTGNLLIRLGVSLRRFNKLLAGKAELTAREAQTFAHWLNVDTSEIHRDQIKAAAEAAGLTKKVA